MFISIINLLNQSSIRIQKNQARYLNEILILKVLKIFLNFGNFESSHFFQMYDEDLSFCLSNNFFKLKSYPKIQIKMIELSNILSSKRLILDYMIKQELILDFIRNMEYCNLDVLESTVKSIICFSKQKKLVNWIFNFDSYCFFFSKVK